MEDVTNLSNMIFVSIVVQVYNFHEKLEKLKKSFGSPQIKEVTKSIVKENLQRDNYHVHSTGTFRTQSNI